MSFTERGRNEFAKEANHELFFCISNTEMLTRPSSGDIKYTDGYMNLEFQRDI